MTFLDEHIFDRQGRPLTVEEFFVLHADPLYRRVACARLHKVWVSTVWLGLNHSAWGPLEIFETMVFVVRRRDRNAPWNFLTWRYPTEATARRGHEALVNHIRARGVGRLEYWWA